ncbi:patatin-like phospholipase family protein [Pseudohalioglobus sediminis]|uniref:Patatin-like phospholipase family protein n=1 Tax=Pseudohalioglobus sediminis TaxID=2606449 RepID=A0A5B0WUD5_9GAMM|nr:patatin-like phospholipase family protein [Pseudohalioglobus sediminis]KAA1190506.1 patatin-like phospholipase family protein [Pseudohalioglobus sediminis]
MTFRNAIFAGGGSRCLWQLGFWDGANSAGLALNRSVRYAASTSAGSAMATAALLDRAPEALELFKRLTADNPRNIHWQNLRPGTGKPLLPHMDMYRRALEEFLVEDDLVALQDRRLEFLMARFPRYLPTTPGTLLAFSLYGVEKHLTGVLHPSWTRRLGFEQLVQGNHDVDSVEELIEIILASSCVPPVLPGNGYRGQRVLDGGIIDNVPAHLADGLEGRTLVLLSKRYPRPLPEPGRRVYVQPSQPVRIDKFDYANPEGLQETYDLGRRDGQAFADGLSAQESLRGVSAG